MAEPDEDGEGWTEAYDASAPRADMVKTASNGTPFLMAKGAEEGGAGMFAAEDVAALAAHGEDLAAELAKADGDAADPGSPAWEAQDAATAEQAITQLTSLRTLVQQLAQREGAEVGAGHIDDLDDAFDLQGVDAALACALKTLAGFAFSEHAEAGEATPQDAAPVAKAESGQAVHDTISKLAAAHTGCAVCAGWIAGAKQQSAHQQPSQPPEDANDGPAANQQAPQPAPKPTPAAPAAVTTPEQTMTKSTAPEDTTATTEGAAAEAEMIKAKKTEKKARRAAVEAALLKATETVDAKEAELAELRKRVADLEAQPAQGSGPAFNGVTPNLEQIAVRAPGAPSAVDAGVLSEVRKAIADEPDELRKSQLAQSAVVAGLKEIFSQPPTMR